MSRIIAMHRLYIEKSGELLIPVPALQILELLEVYGCGKIDRGNNEEHRGSGPETSG